MILLAHIVSSIISIIGSYMSGITIFKMVRHGESIDRTRTIIRRGTILTTIGIIIVTLSGFALLFDDMEKFFSRPYFFANLSVILIIFTIEAAFLFIKNQKWILLNRTLSMYSWTWVFAIATIEPTVSYAVVMGIYVVLGVVITYGVNQLVKKSPRSL